MFMLKLESIPLRNPSAVSRVWCRVYRLAIMEFVRLGRNLKGHGGSVFMEPLLEKPPRGHAPIDSVNNAQPS